MNRFALLLFVGLLSFPMANIHAQEIEIIKFADNFSTPNGSESVTPIRKKSERLNSRAGKILNINETDIPDSLSVCIAAAIDIWEPMIQNTNPIYIGFSYSDLPENNDIEVECAYYSNNRDTYYPSSLYHNINKSALREEDDTDIDAHIYINRNVLWDCSHNGSSIGDRKNLTTAILRAIAISLGFGSSVTITRNVIAFNQLKGYSIFDNYVLSSTGKRLSQIPNGGKRYSQELVDYVQPTESKLYVLNTSSEYELYAPTPYQQYKSLIFLNNPNSLMFHDIAIGDKNQQIDSITISVLNKIGWDIQPYKPIEIIGEDENQSGILSAYEPHSFHIAQSEDGNIENSYWRFSLPLKDGTEAIVKTLENSTTFKIDALSNSEAYKTNINGDIYGHITFSGSLNNKTVEDTYRISLELKPKIKKVTILKKESNSPYLSYNVYFTVEYTGSETLKFVVEEEDSPLLLYNYIDEPFLAHGVAKGIASDYYAWIDITASNKYGSDTYTIELEPYISENYSYRTTSNDNPSLSIENYDTILVYNCNGIPIREIQDYSELDDLPSGMYICNYIKSNKCINRTKYIKK